jgi:hypothetical protein
MENLIREVNTLTNEIMEEWNLTPFEAMQIAVKIQQNSILKEAFVLGYPNTPGALESIAMELGACDDSLTIKDVLMQLSERK